MAEKKDNLVYSTKPKTGPDGWPIRTDLVEQCAIEIYCTIQESLEELNFDLWLEAEEWMRDDYRNQARAILNLLKVKKLLKEHVKIPER